MSKRAPGQRAGLDRQQIVECSLALLTEEGLEALSIRRVAKELGVAPNSLYSHVADKTALIDAVLDDVLARVEYLPRSSDDSWQSIQRIMTSTFEVLIDHPDIVPLYLSRQGARGPNAIQLGDRILEHLAREGISNGRATDALHVLIVYTIGFAAFGSSTTDKSLDTKPVSLRVARSKFLAGLNWLIEGIKTQGHPGRRIG